MLNQLSFLADTIKDIKHFQIQDHFLKFHILDETQL